METILITGSAGFIGFYTAKALLEQGNIVIGYDNMNDYYDTGLKRMRTDILMKYSGFAFYEADICDVVKLEEVANTYSIDIVIHLAAQAGVRYSLTCPEKYIETNIVGTFRILELCRKYCINRFMYASSSSVYGQSEEKKLRIGLKTDFPVSLYAATKKSDEVIVYTYCNNFGINGIGMRFFTVYGPMGRPDMAYWKFVDKIFHNEPIEVFNYGNQYRDFTYIDDLLEGIMGLFSYCQKLKKEAGFYEIYNIGSGKSIKLMKFISIIEKIVGKEADKVMCEKRTGDVEQTYADITDIQKVCNFYPRTCIEDGLKKFYDWYKGYIV